MYRTFGVFIFAGALSVCFSGLAAEPPSAPELPQFENPYKGSGLPAAIQELGLPSVVMLAEQEQSAYDLFAGGDCASAIPVIERFAKGSNLMADLITAGMQPFYRARRDDQNEFAKYSGPEFEQAKKTEAEANRYKEKRNTAMVMHGECLLKMKKPAEAAIVYSAVLRIIPVEELALWERARLGLYSSIGIDDFEVRLRNPIDK